MKGLGGIGDRLGVGIVSKLSSVIAIDYRELKKTSEIAKSGVVDELVPKKFRRFTKWRGGDIK